MEILLNITVISLLVVTITYCWRLNRKIADLKNSKKDFGALVNTFDSAIIKTHKSIADLKVMSQTSSAELQQYVQKASELISDLAFMTNTASKLADRLEASIGVARIEVAQQESSRPHPTHPLNITSVATPIGKKPQPLPSNNNSSKTKEQLLNTIKLMKQS